MKKCHNSATRYPTSMTHCYACHTPTYRIPLPFRLDRPLNHPSPISYLSWDEGWLAHQPMHHPPDEQLACHAWPSTVQESATSCPMYTLLYLAAQMPATSARLQSTASLPRQTPRPCIPSHIHGVENNLHPISMLHCLATHFPAPNACHPSPAWQAACAPHSGHPQSRSRSHCGSGCTRGSTPPHPASEGMP